MGKRINSLLWKLTKTSVSIYKNIDNKTKALEKNNNIWFGIVWWYLKPNKFHGMFGENL